MQSLERGHGHEHHEKERLLKLLEKLLCKITEFCGGNNACGYQGACNPCQKPCGYDSCGQNGYGSSPWGQQQQYGISPYASPYGRGQGVTERPEKYHSPYQGQDYKRQMPSPYGYS